MTLADFLALLKECPLIASVQASPGSPLDDPETLLKLAQASLSQGVKVLRLEGVENIKRIKGETGATVIGLIKRKYPDSEVYITPTMREVEELLETGCEVIALDATPRSRPGADLRHIVSAVHAGSALALADCDRMDSGRHAIAAECDLLSTTLAGYTPDTTKCSEPDVPLVANLAILNRPVLAEGRYSSEQQIQMARIAGASGVVIGGAINDPIKQTHRFLSAAVSAAAPVGAVDLGGTWIRFAKFSPDFQLLEKSAVRRQDSNKERLDWISRQCQEAEVALVGISSGGTISPRSGMVMESKDTIPDNLGFFELARAHILPKALNDGLATAWGHACHPKYLGSRVLTLTMGTGVGCGLVSDHRLHVGRNGEYPRVNDLSLSHGRTVEELLGGRARDANDRRLTTATLDSMARADLLQTIHLLQGLYAPDHIVLAGSGGLNEQVSGQLVASGIVDLSPFGEDAGLYGAAALALFPPIGVFPE
ncbi:MAG: putative N-acetylmannosamine-6-phosphate 2-epimerase [Armatimonadetes bacterium]|nr:putative N-acetylmannosamine-6-phosphate 2-epimerase [Armatimonadota bacterium]